MGVEKFRYLVGILVTLVSSIYFIWGGFNFGVIEESEVLKIDSEILKVVEKPNKRKQSLHYTFFCKGLTNEFYVSPEYTNLLYASTLQNYVIETPSQMFEIGIKNSQKEGLNSNKRIDVYSIKADDDSILNIHRVIDKTKSSRKFQLFASFGFFIATIFFSLKYSSS